MKNGELMVSFYHADKPVFTLDCKYLLYIDGGQTLIVYCLGRMAPMRYLSCDAEQLLALPVQHAVVAMTSWSSSSESPGVTLWDFHEAGRLLSLSGVAAGGIRDVSKDGRLAVDADLQVFDLDSGALTTRIEHGQSADELTYVRLTYDGAYVVWLDTRSIKVGRVSDGSLVAHTCTHERPTSLCTLDSGYVLVVGREDGRILMMKLVVDGQQSHDAVRPRNADERCAALHGRLGCSETTKAGFDVLYRRRVQSVRSSELMRAGEGIRSVLTHRAKAPLLSTATSKPAVDPAADRYRRSYSQLSPLSGSSSYHDIACSSDDLADDSDVTAGRGLFTDRRSRSVTDVLAMCTLGRATPAPPAHKHKFLGHLLDFGATFRSRRKKYRRREPAAVTDSRDRVPSV